MARSGATGWGCRVRRRTAPSAVPGAARSAPRRTTAGASSDTSPGSLTRIVIVGLVRARPPRGCAISFGRPVARVEPDVGAQRAGRGRVAEARELVGRQLVREVARLELLEVDGEQQVVASRRRCAARCPTYGHGDARLLELLLELGRIEVLELRWPGSPEASGISPSMPRDPGQLLGRAQLEPAGEVAARQLACPACARNGSSVAASGLFTYTRLPVEQDVDVDRVAAAERAAAPRHRCRRAVGGDRQVDAALAGGWSMTSSIASGSISIASSPVALTPTLILTRSSGASKTLPAAV